MILAFISLLTGSIVARLLGPVGRGELAAIQTWGAVIALIAVLGLPDAVVFFSGRFPGKAGAYMSSGIVLCLFSSVPFVLVGYALIPHVLSAQSQATIHSARCYLVFFVPLQATQGMLLHPLRGRSDILPWNLLRISFALSWGAALVIAITIGVSDSGQVAAFYLGSLALASLPALLVVRHRVRGDYSPRGQLWGPMLKYGLPLTAAALPQLLNARLDQMLMAAFLPPASLGCYAVAVAWGSAGSPVFSSVGAIVFPRLAMQSIGVIQKETLIRSIHLGAMLAVALGLPLLAITPVAILSIFGGAYFGAIPAACILVVTGSVLGVNAIIQESLRGLGFTKAILLAETAGLAVIASLLWVLLPPLGILGAALSSLAGSLASGVALLRQLRRHADIGPKEALVPHRQDMAILLAKLKSITRRFL